MANKEIHMKDFFDVARAYEWIDEVTDTYDLKEWHLHPEVRFLSNNTVQVLLTFRKNQPEFEFNEDCEEDTLHDNDNVTPFRS